MLGFGRSQRFQELDDTESKRVIEVVLKYINETFGDLDWQGLSVGYSSSDFTRLHEHLEKLDLNRLKIILDIEGFAGIPDDWIALAEFLMKAQRGKQYHCNDLLNDLARLIVLKASGLAEDKSSVWIFRKAPLADVIKFFKKFKVTPISSKEHA